ncbi:iron chelate uptake ABC transporter family permease subunit [Sutterella wadsworthensis]|uniref:iron chelate uptake ABC transporter family permease subunit n=1 Tax=Sutterella wadsworthensis TaxID=40545 RepID=UPI00241F83F7|nr:iron chelate uptake ABC transporter family permease subunit [Sutterella wadsworthensis]
MTRSTCILLVLLTLMSVLSLFVGAADITPADVLSGDIESLELMLISRLPRLLAILCTGMGMSIAGLIMQQLCANKFVSPTTGATISSAQFGILIALLFFPDSTLWSRALFAFAAAILGTWTFVWFILRMPMKDPVMVPLVGIMFGNVIGGVTNFLAYRFDMTQALSTWLVGHFSLVLRGTLSWSIWSSRLLCWPGFLPSTSTSSAWAEIFRRTSALITRSSFSAVSPLPR